MRQPIIIVCSVWALTNGDGLEDGITVMIPNHMSFSSACGRGVLPRCDIHSPLEW